MAKVILIAGLPGSGKTTYGYKLKAEVNAADFVDDYHAKAIENSPKFENGRQYEQLICGLKKGETWIARTSHGVFPRRGVKLRKLFERSLRGSSLNGTSWRQTKRSAVNESRRDAVQPIAMN